MKAEIHCVEKNAFRTVVEICHEMMVPSGMGEELQRQREMCIDPYTRVANRSKELVPRCNADGSEYVYASGRFCL